MITKEIIVERKEAILVDLDTVKNRLEEIEKAKLENIALQNALMGALQQCDDFLNRLHDESSDDGNDGD
jgi:hypothetical protein